MLQADGAATEPAIDPTLYVDHLTGRTWFEWPDPAFIGYVPVQRAVLDGYAAAQTDLKRVIRVLVERCRMTESEIQRLHDEIGPF